MVSQYSSSTCRRAAGGLSAALVATGAVALAGAGTTSAGATAQQVDGDCRVVRLQQPDGFGDGAVMDIERVNGRTVYYGNSYRGTGDRAKQRAFVWNGLRADPVMVGPRGRWDLVIALELTSTGLVNGTAESFDGSRARSWVQDLATGELAFYRTESGPRGEDHGFTWIRRIDDQGAGVGTAFRSDDPEGEPGTDAVGFDGPAADMEFLTYPVEYLEAGAFGINNAGEAVGYYADEFLDPENEFWTIWTPVRWNPDGSRTELATPYGLEAFPRTIEDDGGVGGLLAYGEDPLAAHLEAAYWPDAGSSVALGLLPGGDYSDAFGGDEGGRLVGLANRRVRKGNRFGDHGYVDHSFWWSPQTTEGTVRVLPSLYGDRRDLGWRTWVGGAAHAVASDLDQAGTSTHAGFDGRRKVFAPTVYVNASQCGREVATTHEPGARRTGSARQVPGAPVHDWKAQALD